MQTFLSVAVAAARAAGEMVRASLGQYQSLESKSNAHDLVTNVDRACEETISRMLLGAFPGHAILGEEGVTQGAARHLREDDPTKVEHLWICDPIDGTTNFVHGIPCCTVAICLALRGEPVLGVVYDPMRDELFSAARGAGAYVNGRPMQVRPDTLVHDSLLGTGFSSLPEVRSRNVRDMVALSTRCRNIRNLGSAQMHLAYVAAGRLTGFWEHGLAPWDLAAGYVLVSEAGGSMTDLSGQPYTLAAADVLATNGGIHAEMVQLLASSAEAVWPGAR